MKQQCSVCDDALDALTSVARRIPFTLHVRDIRERADWFSQYRYRVPVVCINGHESLELRFTEAALEAALRAGQAALPDACLGEPEP